jgi:hypothetical protein
MAITGAAVFVIKIKGGASAGDLCNAFRLHEESLRSIRIWKKCVREFHGS